MGVSLDKYSIALLLADGGQRQAIARYALARDFVNIALHSVASIIVLVTGEQIPWTALGVTFVTLEDHTGNCNVVERQATANAQKNIFKR